MSTDERMQKIEGQLARVRWFNRCLIACIVLSLGVWFISKTFTPETAWAQSGVKEIRANRFTLEDENGKPRAVLSVSKDGQGLLLYNEMGKNRAGLVVTKEGPMLMLNDGNGQLRARLAVLEDGAGLRLFDESRKPRVELHVSKEGPEGPEAPRLILTDENGKIRALLGKGQATTRDGKVVSYPESSLILSGADGKVVWSAP
jgi:hypothetical protein